MRGVSTMHRPVMHSAATVFVFFLLACSNAATAARLGFNAQSQETLQGVLASNPAELSQNFEGMPISAQKKLSLVKQMLETAARHDAVVAASLAALDDGDDDDSSDADTEGDDREAVSQTSPSPDPGPEDPKFCYRKQYRKRTLKVIKEAPFIGLFNDLLNNTQFEASGIVLAKGAYWVVFDSLRAVGRIGLQFQFRGEVNRLVPEDVGEANSQFEGLAYMPSSDTFLVLRESTQHEKHGLVPTTEEMRVSQDQTCWTAVRECPIKYNIADPNKGMESIVYFERDGNRFLLGLCESNFCGSNVGKDPPGKQRGNGRVVLSQLVESEDGSDCHWEPIKVIHIPPTCYFVDYAGLAFVGGTGSRVGIVSQEDAALWVSSFNWDTLEFEDEGQVYHFPRDNDCSKVYCNVEGLAWIDSHRLIFTSDRSKFSQGPQCMGKDQSVHIMAIP